MKKKKRSKLPAFLVGFGLVAVLMVCIGTSGFTDWIGTRSDYNSSPSDNSDVNNSIAVINQNTAVLTGSLPVENNTLIEFNTTGIGLDSTALILFEEIYDYENFVITLDAESANITDYYYTDVTGTEPIVHLLDFDSFTNVSISETKQVITINCDLPVYDDVNGWQYSANFIFPLFVRIVNATSVNYSVYCF